MITLTREKGNRMWGGGSGSGGVGGGGSEVNLAGYATQSWVDDNYLSIEFFSKLFKAYNGTTLVNPNDTESTITNIKAMFGFWTEQYLSALGQNSSGGGGGGVTLNEPLNGINNAGLPAHPSVSGQTIIWNGSSWVYGNTGGGVTSIGMEVPTGLVVSGVPITSSGTIALSYATGYGIPLTADVSNGVTAYGWGNHANAGYLTGITAAMINSALGFTLNGTAGTTYNLATMTSNISTLQGYFDASGNAKSALKLTTVSKTAWGRTFWTSGGIPTNVTGNMTDVGSITMNGTIYGARGLELNNNTGHGVDGGFIDFHFNGDSGDYTSRIIEDVSGRIQFVVPNGIRIGSGVLIWDSTGNALKVQKADGTAANFYATGGISALGLTPGTAGSISNLTVNNYLYFGNTNNYLHSNVTASTTTLQMVSGGKITLNTNCNVSADGNTLTVSTLSSTNVSSTNVSSTNVSSNKLTTGTTTTAGTIEIYYNGTKYYLNKSAAISAGILTTSNG